jgi:pyrophosphatase PpaX
MNNSIGRISCVIFDMDGTLTRTNDLIFESFNFVAEKYVGKRLSPQEIIALFGPPEEGGLEKIVGAENVDGAMNELCEYYQTHHKRLASLHEGVEDILRWLGERKVKLAIFTGKGQRTASITLRELGIERYFELVVSGSDVQNHKPHHEGIARIVEHFSVRPDEVLMVGDSVGDIRASRAAGVKVASVVWDSYDRERVLQEEADLVFHSVTEMYDWLKTHIN